ncbi:hypothetical protein GCM10007916_03850 [Psychromonas marina]|uniref:DUF4382 domain-containing protein n=1 Tax=Psychromonas marina TaxID=88364 RepID=A0ABQ6DWE1_9GAMM|nr:DUF4382 domain-containing protein [Psychromonas marina]GLS89318.1 hypothetical protein GCM10007916_03850 [Psychromonas marina]
MTHKYTYLAALLPLFMLSGCGSSSDNTSEGETTFSLSVSDAPVDDLSEVMVCFSQVELKGGSEDLLFEVGDGDNMIMPNEACVDDNEVVIANTLGIDLLAYPGSASFTLLEDIIIPAGEYSQLRLAISDGSYGVLEDSSKVEIQVPSNELKLDGFTAVISGVSDLTVEFDLRKGMTDPVGQDHYILKPRGVRLVDNSTSATISGSADALQLCSLTAPEEGDFGGSIYLYQGFNLDINDLSDNGGSGTYLPYASTLVSYDGENYGYEIGFVAADDYTIAFSCATEDDPDEDDGITFLQKQEMTLESSDIVVNFEATDL